MPNKKKEIKGGLLSSDRQQYQGGGMLISDALFNSIEDDEVRQKVLEENKKWNKLREEASNQAVSEVFSKIPGSKGPPSWAISLLSRILGRDDPTDDAEEFQRLERKRLYEERMNDPAEVIPNTKPTPNRERSARQEGRERGTRQEGGLLNSDRQQYQAGAEVSMADIPMPQEDIAMPMPQEDIAMPMPQEEMAMAPDEQMEDDYLDFVVSQSLSPEEENHLMDTLSADPQLSIIFDKLMDTATEFAGSGPVEGPGSEVSDSIPARLSDGEFVLTAKATDEIGSDNIEAMMQDAEARSDKRQMAEGGIIQENLNREEDDEINKAMIGVNPRMQMG